MSDTPHGQQTVTLSIPYRKAIGGKIVEYPVGTPVPVTEAEAVRLRFVIVSSTPTSSAAEPLNIAAPETGDPEPFDIAKDIAEDRDPVIAGDRQKEFRTLPDRNRQPTIPRR